MKFGEEFQNCFVLNRVEVQKNAWMKANTHIKMLEKKAVTPFTCVICKCGCLGVLKIVQKSIAFEMQLLNEKKLILLQNN